MTNAQELAERLNGRKSGDGYIACCPAHDDQNPSLSIKEMDGKILLHCYANCSQEVVVEAVKRMGLWHDKKSKEKRSAVTGLDDVVLKYKSNLSPGLMSFIRSERAISDHTVDLYDLGQKENRLSIPIKNAEGKVEDIRLYLPSNKRTKAGSPKVMPDKNTDASPKLFPLQVLDDLKAENVENLGYLELVEQRHFLLLCEGEMDALAAISARFKAITNTCGANVWSDEFSQQIAEIDVPVVILMDNDVAGEEGTIKRAESLARCGVKTYIANWPENRGLKHDITDEIKKFGPESLLEIVKTAKRHSDIVYMDEVESEEITWLFKPYIAVKKTTMVEGEPGIGKSFISVALAALTSIGGESPVNVGEKFLQGKTLLLSGEDGLGDTIRPRLEKMPANLKQIFAPKEIFTLDEKGFDFLIRLIEEERPILVIIDPMTPFLDAKKDVNKATDMRPFFKQLAKIATKYSCAIVVTRHLAKSLEQKGISRGLGSIDIAAAVRSILQIEADNKDKSLRRVTHIKSNLAAKGATFGYKLEEDNFSWTGKIEDEPSEDEEAQSELDRAQEFIFEALKNGPMDATEVLSLAKDMGISKSTLIRAKKKLSVRTKKITDAGKTSLWRWYLQDYQGSQDSQQSSAPRTVHFNDPESYKEEA